MARTARNCQQQNSIIQQLASDTFDQIIAADDPTAAVTAAFRHQTLSISAINAIDMPLRDEVLRLGLAKVGIKSLSHAHLVQLYKVCAAGVDANPVLQLGSHQVRRYQNRLYILNKQQATSAGRTIRETVKITSLPFSYDNILLVDDNNQQKNGDASSRLLIRNQAISIKTVYADKNATEQGLCLRFGQLGLTAKLDSKRPTKTLKQWFKELNIAPWLRHQVPVLCQGNRVLAIILEQRIETTASAANKSKKGLCDSINVAILRRDK